MMRRWEILLSDKHIPYCQGNNIIVMSMFGSWYLLNNCNVFLGDEKILTQNNFSRTIN